MRFSFQGGESRTEQSDDDKTERRAVHGFCRCCGCYGCLLSGSQGRNIFIEIFRAQRLLSQGRDILSHINKTHAVPADPDDVIYDQAPSALVKPVRTS